MGVEVVQIQLQLTSSSNSCSSTIGTSSSISSSPSACSLGIPVESLERGVNARCITAVTVAKHINNSQYPEQRNININAAEHFPFFHILRRVLVEGEDSIISSMGDFTPQKI